MRLNPDCIRDILLSVEEATEINVLFEYNRDDRGGTRLGAYDHDAIRYHIRQCEMAGLITRYREFDAGSYIKIPDLTPAGHEFLANTRSPSLWESLRESCAQAGVDSLSAMLQGAAKLAASALLSRITSGS